MAFVGVAFTAAQPAFLTLRKATEKETEPETAEKKKILKPGEKKNAPPAPPPFDPKQQPGVTLPLMYWDPLEFCKFGDRDAFYDLRCKELKHGRLAMLASIGNLLPHWQRFPPFENVPNGLKAVITPPGTYGLAAVLALAAVIELFVWPQDPEKEPGDFGDPAGVGQGRYVEWKNRELNNGRMAMLAMLGIWVAELATGFDGPDQVRPLAFIPVE